jgi:hypothetical protein
MVNFLPGHIFQAAPVQRNEVGVFPSILNGSGKGPGRKKGANHKALQNGDQFLEEVSAAHLSESV